LSFSYVVPVRPFKELYYLNKVIFDDAIRDQFYLTEIIFWVISPEGLMGCYPENLINS